MEGVRGYVDERSATEAVAGLGRMIDALTPGVNATYSFHPPSPNGRIELAGRDLTVLWAAHPAVYRTSWLLPNETLLPDHEYVLKLAGANLEVLPIVRV